MISLSTILVAHTNITLKQIDLNDQIHIFLTITTWKTAIHHLTGKINKCIAIKQV